MKKLLNLLLNAAHIAVAFLCSLAMNMPIALFWIAIGLAAWAPELLVELAQAVQQGNTRVIASAAHSLLILAIAASTLMEALRGFPCLMAWTPRQTSGE